MVCNDIRKSFRRISFVPHSSSCMFSHFGYPRTENSKKPNLRPEQIWNAIGHLLAAFDVFSGVATQIAFLINLSRGEDHGLLFVLLCLDKPFANLFKAKQLWALGK